MSADAARMQVRPMSIGDLQQVLEWAAAEGWNPGLHDAHAFHAADPAGFLIGVLDGEAVASISVVRYAPHFGFLGCYIVREGWRGRGLGYALWRAGLRHLEGCNVGLDGVVAQQANYRKSGFRYAYGNQRHEGRGGGTRPHGIVDACELPVDWILAYDAPRFPAPRAGFVTRWLTLPGTHAFAAPGNGAVHGYAVLRPCRSGFKIGPLFADDAPTADALLRAAAASAPPGAPLYLDTPLPNAAALALAQRHGMQPVFETARMYTGPDPDIDLQTVFGVTSFELG
jgi:GNAT superfamily N-acetyltransferase